MRFYSHSPLDAIAESSILSFFLTSVVRVIQIWYTLICEARRMVRHPKKLPLLLLPLPLFFLSFCYGEDADPGMPTTTQEIPEFQIDSGIAPGKIYVGEPISLDLQDADIRNVLRLLAEMGNINIILSDRVKGKVTMKLKNVPWDQALDVILSTHNLGMTRYGSGTDDPPRQQTVEIDARGDDETIIEVIKLECDDVTEFADALTPLLSDAGRIVPYRPTNSLIIRDRASVVDRIVSIIDQRPCR
jgi:hypothetical protein